jgi:hypothetical protein
MARRVPNTRRTRGRTAKNYGGRPSYVPSDEDRKKVEALAAVGAARTDIAKMLKIDVKTMRRHFARELETGAIQANAMVCGALFQACTVDRNVNAIIWWMKNRMGWRENPVAEEASPEEYARRVTTAIQRGLRSVPGAASTAHERYSSARALPEPDPHPEAGHAD